MTLRRWDIVFLRADERDPTGHPAVVLSADDFLADPRNRRFNVVVGSKKPPAYSVQPHHALLDEADGLDHLTMVDCALVHAASKAAIIRAAGSVTEHRRGEIRRKIRANLGLG